MNTGFAFRARRVGVGVLAFSILMTACVGGVGRNAGAQRRAPLNPNPPTVVPADLANSDTTAVQLVSRLLTPRDGEHRVSTGHYFIADLTSVIWARTTIGAVHQYFAQVSPQPAAGNFPGSANNTTAWLFELRGSIQELSRTAPGGAAATSG